ncbi:MAG: hypothetical protein FJY82_13215 [Candidatus Aminicenantes bacterium]|nr:hypothetical protein [Candidatus Aminicenantes bacterium]
MPPRLIDSHLDFLRRAGRFESPLPVDPAVCRDPGDLHILGVALQGRAGVIVSGDKDLLNLGSFRKIPILSPRTFWERKHISRRRIQSRRPSYGRKRGSRAALGRRQSWA